MKLWSIVLNPCDYLRNERHNPGIPSVWQQGTDNTAIKKYRIQVSSSDAVFFIVTFLVDYPVGKTVGSPNPVVQVYQELFFSV